MPGTREGTASGFTPCQGTFCAGATVGEVVPLSLFIVSHSRTERQYP